VKKPELTKEELAAEREATITHQTMVQDIMKCVSNIVVARGRAHDKSKLSDKELPLFAQATSLKKLPYGSKQYNDQLSIGSMLRPALDHHYANNRHHPEHHEDGIPGMNLVTFSRASTSTVCGLRSRAAWQRSCGIRRLTSSVRSRRKAVSR